MSNEQTKPASNRTRTGQRSPAYPAINLRAAIDRARKFYEHEKKNSAPASIVPEHWGFAAKSSGGRSTLSALIKFGLLEESGRGDNRRVKITPLAVDILLDERPNSPERIKAIKQAALTPEIHIELWNRWGTELPSEATMRTVLLKDLDFTNAAVSDLIKEYRDTIEFAKLESSDKIKPENTGGESAFLPTLKTGSFVQWTSNGVDMFPQPRLVEGLYDEEYAFVEGSPTGVPIKELSVVSNEPSVETNASEKVVPPRNPYSKPSSTKPELHTALSLGVKEDAYDLVEGRVLLHWPEGLNAESVDELNEWFNLIIKKMRRMAGRATAVSLGATNSYKESKPSSFDEGRLNLD